tara:strand:+ start:55 stop:804 length:750 start_codon:yes stop_codon:yes gene_type:complete
MLPKSFKPDGAYELIRMGSDHDGGYLVDPKSIEQSNALIALGVGRNWSFEKDFLERKSVRIHAYDYSIGLGYWIKHFLKRVLAVLIGRFSAPFDAVKLFLEFKIFFKDSAVLYLEKVGTAPGCDTNLKKALDRLDRAPLFLKVDIEGYEYQILEEIIRCKDDLTGLVIEFHSVSDNIEQIEDFINKIGITLIHIHPNNNRLDEEGDPKAIELTFSKNPTKLEDKFIHPHALDQNNVPRKDSVSLRFTEV